MENTIESISKIDKNEVIFFQVKKQIIEKISFFIENIEIQPNEDNAQISFPRLLFKLIVEFNNEKVTYSLKDVAVYKETFFPILKIDCGNQVVYLDEKIVIGYFESKLAVGVLNTQNTVCIVAVEADAANLMCLIANDEKYKQTINNILESLIDE